MAWRVASIAIRGLCGGDPHQGQSCSGLKILLGIDEEAAFGYVVPNTHEHPQNLLTLPIYQKENSPSRTTALNMKDLEKIAKTVFQKP